MSPVYDFRCDEHGEVKDVYANYEDTVVCRVCGEPMTRLISAPNVIPDWEPYLEHNMGHEPVYIKSRQHYYEECYSRGLNNMNDTRGRVNNDLPSKGEE